MEISLVFQQHPSEDTWEEYAFGRLSEQKAASLEGHLLCCDACQTTLADVDLYLHAFKAATRQPILVPEREKLRTGVFRPPRRLALVTAVTVALLAAVLLLRQRPAQEPVFLTLASLRGDNGGAPTHAPAHRSLAFSVNADDLSPAPEYRLEVVTSRGKPVWSSRVVPAGGKLSARLSGGLGAGVYWVRLYGRDSVLLSEFGLQLQ